MPKTKDKLPPIGTAVKFRIEGGSTHLHEGTYTAKGFEHCEDFICYNTREVDYWCALTNIEPINPWQYHVTIHHDEASKLFVGTVMELSKIKEYGDFPFQVYKKIIETIKKTTAMNTARGVRTAQPKK